MDGNLHGTGGQHQEPFHGNAVTAVDHPFQSGHGVGGESVGQRLPCQRAAVGQGVLPPGSRGSWQGSGRRAGQGSGRAAGQGPARTHPLRPVIRSVMLIRPVASPPAGSAVPAWVRGTPW